MQTHTIALSVRQPWAWAIVYGGKDVENRSTFAVTKAGFDPRPICIHAAKGMTRGIHGIYRRYLSATGGTGSQRDYWYCPCHRCGQALGLTLVLWSEGPCPGGSDAFNQPNPRRWRPWLFPLAPRRRNRPVPALDAVMA